VPGAAQRHGGLRQSLADRRIRAREYTRAHGEDDPEIAGWRWSGA